VLDAVLDAAVVAVDATARGSTPIDPAAPDR
jgi:hypothetical protein